MRIVITRPDRSGEKTAAKLKALGYDPVLLPLFHPVHHTDIARTALGVPASALAVTSAEAIRALKPLGATLEPHLATPLFSVGEATAKAARQAGFRKVLTAAGDGTSLATLVVQKRAMLSADAPLLYLAGTPRASAFETGLLSASIPFRVAECYAMQESAFQPDLWEKALLSETAEAVMLYSAEAARAFFRTATKPDYVQALNATRFICMSANVAANIPEIFRDRASTAETTSEAAMFKLLHAGTGT